MAPSNSQWDDAVRNYCLNILKVKKIAVIGDTTGYGVTAVGASVAAFKKDGADVVYQANVDSTQPDMTPDMLRAKNAGAEVIVVWSVSTGMEARMFNTRAAMNWDVAFVGHPSMASGELAGLVEKPANWKKVYAIGYKSCSYDAAGKLPPKSEDLVARLTKANVVLSDTLLWWVAGGIDAIELIAKAVAESGSTDSAGIIAYWNTLSKYPGYFGNYSFSPTQHNGYLTEEIVMSEASHRQERHVCAGAGIYVSGGRGRVAHARLDPRIRSGGGRDLRARRRHLQHHVLDLAGDELHRRPARHARRRVRFDVHAEAGHADPRRLPADAARCAIIGIITEFVAVRPVLKSLDQHLYVLSTLALALMIQQVAAIKWGTEPQPFPRLFGHRQRGLG